MLDKVIVKVREDMKPVFVRKITVYHSCKTVGIIRIELDLLIG